jgi:hypothetical protein
MNQPLLTEPPMEKDSCFLLHEDIHNYKSITENRARGFFMKSFSYLWKSLIGNFRDRSFVTSDC